MLTKGTLNTITVVLEDFQHLAGVKHHGVVAPAADLAPQCDDCQPTGVKINKTFGFTEREGWLEQKA